MRPSSLLLSLLPFLPAAALANPPRLAPANPRIDMPGYLRLAHQAAAHRAGRRVDEAEFIRLSREAGTVIVDARSREKYDLLHVRGAVNLSFPDITAASLERLLPDKATRVLIYCNNNFEGAPAAFPTKMAPASLNLSTYIALYTYGYRNLHELAPLLDVRTTRIELVPSAP